MIIACIGGSKVEIARKNLIGKAKEKPEQVKQVIDTLKKEGILATYNKVMNKLDSLSPLGYSSAGVVIEIGSEVSNFKVGDRVACTGQEAFHGEVISVPVNLAVKLPDNADLEDAAYTKILDSTTILKLNENLKTDKSNYCLKNK